MWYFTWILGLSMAVLFAVVNAMWLEMQEDQSARNDRPGADNQESSGTMSQL